MSIHSSLRRGGQMARHRNVLTRKERLEKLEGKDKWNAEEDGVTGLPKVRSIKVAVKKKKKDEDADEATPEAAAEAAV